MKSDDISVDPIFIGGMNSFDAIVLCQEKGLSYLQLSSESTEPIVTICLDGRVEVNPKYSADEAAKAFWDAVQKISAQAGKL